jgi:hypothetical protein
MVQLDGSAQPIPTASVPEVYRVARRGEDRRFHKKKRKAGISAFLLCERARRDSNPRSPP